MRALVRQKVGGLFVQSLHIVASLRHSEAKRRQYQASMLLACKFRHTRDFPRKDAGYAQLVCWMLVEPPGLMVRVPKVRASFVSALGED